MDRSSRKISDPTSWGSGSPSIARGKMSLPEIVLEVKNNDRQFCIFTVLQKKSEKAEHVKCSECALLLVFSGLKLNILVTQSPKYTSLMRITNQFPFVYMIAKSLYIQLSFTSLVFGQLKLLSR